MNKVLFLLVAVAAFWNPAFAQDGAPAEAAPEAPAGQDAPPAGDAAGEADTAAEDDSATEAEKAGAERVMIVAHNPGLHELATRWAHRNNELETKVRAKFPTCAGAVFARKDKDASWKLQAYVTPKTISD